METVRIGIFGAARIVPSALLKPAQQLTEVVIVGTPHVTLRAVRVLSELRTQKLIVEIEC